MSLGYCATAGSFLRRFERERRPDVFPNVNLLLYLFGNVIRSTIKEVSRVPCRCKLPAKNLENGAISRRAGGRVRVYKCSYLSLTCVVSAVLNTHFAFETVSKLCIKFNLCLNSVSRASRAGVFL
ncbi:hypothetical protein R3P38DRAFT_2777564 [Favolaschia claudopus]|uniref:Uncharacterized protein n=1 Tax=Favolaschia claudopus TaxID=2862362 RepID=A0AAW0BJH3_9AGAR